LLASVALGASACGGGGGSGGNDAAAGSSGKGGADGGAKAGNGSAGADAAGADAAEASDGDAPAAAGTGGDAAPSDHADAADVAEAGSMAVPVWRSGTRLRARLLKAADGVEAIFQSVFDKDLGASCAFVKASDGATRCMPSAVVPYYADAECKVPVLPMAAGCAPATHVSRIDGCQSSGLKVGPKVTPAKTFALNPGGTCVEIPPSGTQELYELTAVAATGFAAATEQRSDRGGGLMMRHWSSEDGGLFPIGAWNKQRAAACVAGTGDYADHCVPAGVAPVSLSVPAFSDDMCKKPVGYAVATCASEPVTAVGLWAGTACGQAMVLAEATKLATMPFRSLTTSCFPWNAPPAGYGFYTPGEAIPIGALPDMNTVLDGAGRLKVRRYESNAFERVDSDPAFYDAIQQGLCLLEDTTKGLRCMSARAFGVTFYADDKCKSPVHVESKTKPAPACAAPRPDVLYVDTGAPACGGLPKLELYAVGAAVTPARLYRADSTMGCVAEATDPTMLDVFGTTPADDATAPAVEIVTE
jgi:hypothetical protein